MDARAFVLKSSCWVLCAVEALATILNAIVGLCGRGVALSDFGSVFSVAIYRKMLCAGNDGGALG